MNSEWAVIYHLLVDPSLVDRAFDLGLDRRKLTQEKTQILFSLIVNTWYDRYSRPAVKALVDSGCWFDGTYSPHQTLEEAILICKERYLKNLIMEKIKWDSK